MLKATYTEAGLHLEQLSQSVEDWIALRSRLAVRTSQRLLIEHCTASILLPVNLARLCLLERAAQQKDSGVVALSVCDADYVEVSLRGVWVVSSADETEGVFATMLNAQIERVFFQLWQESQAYASSRW
jgi:hypothetical protein